MHAFIYPGDRSASWNREIFPDLSPAELPVAGRRIIDYSFQCAQRFGVMFTEVLDWRFSEKLADDFSDLTRTGYPVFYLKGEGPVPAGLRDIERYPSPLTDPVQDGLVVVWGAAISAHTSDEVSFEPVGEEDILKTPAGLYRFEGGRWLRMLPHGMVVRSVKAWHALNFIVMHQSDRFTVPGYSSEKGVHLGRNVILEHGTDVKPPVLMLDNTWCARNVRLDGDVIVESGSFVGEGARLRRTVVCRDTYVGEGLELENKIVAGRRIIDAGTGAWVDVEDKGVARQIPAGLGWARSLWHFVRGRSFGRRG